MLISLPNGNHKVPATRYSGIIACTTCSGPQKLPSNARRYLVMFAGSNHSFARRVPRVVDQQVERATGVRKLFRLVQLEQVAERIVQEGLVPGAGDERDLVHLNALLLQVGDGDIDVVDSDREVVRSERLGVGLHQVHLLAAGVEPEPPAEIGARQLRHTEHVAVEGETLLRVGDADGDMMYTGWLHRSILPRIGHSCMTFRIGTRRLVVHVRPT
jgi:hypothetical protein